ncbi:ATP-dependent Clp protease proteolytic subunit [candidate division WWE3 bacterium]|nr:ATP-dependent Clp protease proteolytic subunit [candidate division WWE3 bacterium]
MNQNSLVPIVVEKNAQGNERSYDIYSRLLKDFIVFVTGPIEMGMANTFIAQMLYLESEDPERQINVYINSPGGVAYAGRAMYDTIRHVKNPVSTINVGLAASAGAMLLAGGNEGLRYGLPGSFTMIHQVLGGVEGQATDVEIEARHMLNLRKQYAQIIADRTGQDLKKVQDDIERNNWMDAEESLNYGIIDKIMEPKD